MSGEYIYRICGVGPGTPKPYEPVAVSTGSPVIIIDTRTHRRSRRKSKRWPHAPTKRIPLPPSDVGYYRVLRGAPMVTHTGRELTDYDAPWWATTVEELSTPWTPKGGRDVQACRMFAKARRRQAKGDA